MLIFVPLAVHCVCTPLPFAIVHFISREKCLFRIGFPAAVATAAAAAIAADVLFFLLSSLATCPLGATMKKHEKNQGKRRQIKRRKKSRTAQLLTLNVIWCHI